MLNLQERFKTIPECMLTDFYEDCKDRYEFIKEAYQQRRHYLETDGKVSDDNTLELELEENMNDSSDNGVPAQGAKETTSTHQLTISSPE
jgi:ABC-type transporter lipoprotein component MlaA